MPFKSDKQRKWMHANEPEMAKKWEKEEKNEGNIGITTKKGKSIELTHKTSGKEIVVVNTPSVLKKYAKMGYLISMPEGKERNYKEEYKKYGSSKKSKKYRAELNKYNRQKGTYGNGDKKDASHKGGKIVGFEEQSKNRGRREKSRLKKEQKLTKSRLTQIIKEELLREKIINITKEVIKEAKSRINGKKVKAMIDARFKIAKVIKQMKWKLGKDYDVTIKPGDYEKGWMTHHLPPQNYQKFLDGLDFVNVKYMKEGKITEAKDTGIDVARRIVKNKQHEKGVDMQTANLIMKIYHAYDKNPALQKKLEKLPLKKLAQGVWRFVK